MDHFLFIVRHIPFWTIPLGIVCVELAAVFYIKERKKQLMTCIVLGVIFFLILAFYYWKGGPDHLVDYFIEIKRGV
jgi:peptidoglycan/LPS O-acetylase OafA/YrhL